jgi:uncharacterized protein YjiS (DUF1127 family)
MTKAMFSLHGSIDAGKHCASAASGYVCPNGRAMTRPGDKKMRLKMAYANTTRASGMGIADRIAGLLGTARTVLAKRRMYAQTWRELNALTDRELADLGMHRALIAEVAREAAYGK